MAAGNQLWKGIRAALPIPNMYRANKKGKIVGSILPLKIPPGVKSRVPVKNQVHIMAISWNPIEVPMRSPRYRRPPAFASGVPLCVTSG